MLHILLLEDDPIDGELISKALSKSGIESRLTQVVNRQDFVKRLNGRSPDLILADYVLPTIDGLTAQQLAQAACPDVPFILVSGVLGEEQAVEALKQGATDYVLKQRLERLGPAVKRALREKQERTERQLVTKALRQTDELLQTIVDASPVGIITLNQNQQVMTWNPTAEQLYGWTAEEVIDHPIPCIPNEQLESFAFYFTQATNNFVISNKMVQHLKQDGSLIDISLSLAPLHDADKDTYGVVMIAVDITLHRQLEAQRLSLLEQERRARAAAENANRIKDDFLAVLSHELRTPLNAILGWIRLIQKGNLKPEVFRRALDTIERNAIIQNQLIKDLLDISRIIRGQVSLMMQPVNMSALIHETVDTLKPSAEAKSIQVTLELAPSLDKILADPNRLQQIFWNLLSNAIKFTPTEGTVTIRCNPVGDQLQVQVIDSGIGIAPEFLPYIFEYFRQADSSTTRSHGGLGLGLAITRRLVELHGGMIQVDSPGVNQGTTFTVKLPMRTSEAQRSFTQTNFSQDKSLEGVKALVVDDEIDAQALLNLILEQRGAEVKSAGSVQEALTVLEDFVPDVIIADIAMPHENGYSLLQTVRSSPDRQFCNVPAIALTAYAREEDRQKAFAAGFQKHITKPFESESLVNAVFTLVNH
jgi:PAS domain S-box-containing protein